jgi:hypothetical protein
METVEKSMMNAEGDGSKMNMISPFKLIVEKQFNINTNIFPALHIYKNKILVAQVFQANLLFDSANDFIRYLQSFDIIPYAILKEHIAKPDKD